MDQTLTYQPKTIGGTHGVSCVFPTLKDIIDYKEGKRVPDQGYPRFVAHPFVASIQKIHQQGSDEIIAVHSREAAALALDKYFDAATREHSIIKSDGEGQNRYGVISVDPEYAALARENITNVGIILGSRKAERILNNSLSSLSNKKLPARLSDLEKGSSPALTFLYLSGMAAIFDAIISFQKKGTGAVVIGNTYVDTRRVFSNLPDRFDYKPTTFINNGEQITIPESTSLVFLEIPSNPLLKVENLKAIVDQAHKKGAIVIVDSTIATSFHFSPFDYDADIVIHSTSKSLSGMNNHMGGVLFVNPAHADYADKLHHEILEMDEDEKNILVKNLNSFLPRIKKMAENAANVVNFLQGCPEIDKLYYPKTGLKNGGSHIISFELNNGDFSTVEKFYDACPLPFKGPSMGFKHTMLMPYTLITHYNDPEEKLKSMGLKRFLLRLSIGTEDIDEIIGHLSTAMESLR